MGAIEVQITLAVLDRDHVEVGVGDLEAGDQQPDPLG